MTWTERTIIKSLADGALQGPAEYCGAWFTPLLVTPVGVRFDGENYIYRDAAIWLSDHTIARLVGLPLIAGIITDVIDSTEFAKRIIGVSMQGFVRDNALWCVARICNNFALLVIQSGKYETRITATFDDDAPQVDVDEGRMIIEPPPRYLSHLSLVPEGSEPFEYGITLINQEVTRYAY